MREAVDMGEVVKSIKNYEALDGMKRPAHIGSDKKLPDVMMDLMAAIHKRGVNPEKCVYWMHPSTHKELREEEETVVMAAGQEAFRGRPIRTHPEIPDDCILFMAPDAVGLGGKVYHPLIIAYAERYETYP